MYKTWTAHAEDADALARSLEAHLNEFAEEVVSVSYAIGTDHCVLAVYRQIDAGTDVREEAAVTLAEKIIDEASP
ncbi:MAG: hypothetical protein NVSMB22_06320 [Chloroflexota bacterium]